MRSLLGGRGNEGRLTMESVAIIGTNPDLPVYVAIKGSVFDVSGKDSYAPKGAYHGQWRLHLSLTSTLLVMLGLHSW